ncbi:hypothetical protein GCM10009535_42800 [Streptomyces thermocarboxydovorans]|uniref:Integral membrane protein n=1 Tax=Streptomyces thermocarboxydovorans TaxID=59298 RepID=A0ABN1HMK9_9ACTN
MTAPHPRTTRTGAGLRIMRAAVFAAVCVVLAGAGHTITSCTAVPLWALGAGFLAALVVAVPLAGRPRSLPGTAAMLAVGQTALHTLFGLGQHGAGSPGASRLSDAALVERAARLACGPHEGAISTGQARRILADARVLPAGGDPHAGHVLADSVSSANAPVSLLPSLPMLLVHVLAALATGWLLRHGDLALLRLAELSAHGVTEGALMRSLRAAIALVRALRAGLPGAPEAAPRTPRTALLAPPPLHTNALHHTVIRRGPPAGRTAFALAA